MPTPSAVRRLAYIIGTFPTLTATFILREIQAREAAGVEIDRFSLRQPWACRHHADGAALVEGRFDRRQNVQQLVEVFTGGGTRDAHSAVRLGVDACASEPAHPR